MHIFVDYIEPNWFNVWILIILMSFAAQVCNKYCLCFFSRYFIILSYLVPRFIWFVSQSSVSYKMSTKGTILQILSICAVAQADVEKLRCPPSVSRFSSRISPKQFYQCRFSLKWFLWLTIIFRQWWRISCSEGMPGRKAVSHAEASKRICMKQKNMPWFH